ncbi:hypothetical protein BDW68DRAFT_172303 [Aspergillus falconensis]
MVRVTKPSKATRFNARILKKLQDAIASDQQERPKRNIERVGEQRFPQSMVGSGYSNHFGCVRSERDS